MRASAIHRVLSRSYPCLGARKAKEIDKESWLTFLPPSSQAEGRLANQDQENLGE